MRTVTFQVIEGIDKGRVYRDLPIPITIGREEGNLLRLNDERVSRYHAKVQIDDNDIILTDLDSTNGTRINGQPVQIRRLRIGDRVGVGRSVLIFGSHEEIAAHMAADLADPRTLMPQPTHTLPSDVTYPAKPPFDLNLDDEDDRFWSVKDRHLPELPQKMTPSQAARLAEILDFLHRGLAGALVDLRPKEDGRDITIPFADWQRIQAVEMLLARYLRAVAEPDALVE